MNRNPQNCTCFKIFEVHHFTHVTHIILLHFKIYTMDETKCACGKIKTSMNLTNWNRHLNACKLKNLKNSARKTKDIKSFFSPHLRGSTCPENNESVDASNVECISINDFTRSAGGSTYPENNESVDASNVECISINDFTRSAGGSTCPENNESVDASNVECISINDFTQSAGGSTCPENNESVDASNVECISINDFTRSAGGSTYPENNESVDASNVECISIHISKHIRFHSKIPCTASGTPCSYLKLEIQQKKINIKMHTFTYSIN
ncbi:uncharacterized protein LOC107882458 [Acyrthosiphon pisum]|uniref:Uncharacterized protein n=1 Tax=Acyrthosiphon pisum TaxID=7029 RepID=A0A8R2D1H3_ACYPI|nr:uncharacterized protein LOC107882458 [Acyrthosiphon pisum]|eukprot:XP_016656294.1 PREDICTED: uncharacterized protein LOC107882458 [Acyrthosiphon pisum]